jgi:hypothetical protein
VVEQVEIMVPLEVLVVLEVEAQMVVKVVLEILVKVFVEETLMEVPMVQEVEVLMKQV